MHTFGLLWCLLSWSSHKQISGGFKAAADKRRVSQMLKAIYTHGIQKQCELDIELVDVWEMTWPRPANREDVETVKLKVRRGGVLDFKSWHDACFREHAPGGVLGPARQRMWLGCIHPFLDDSKCMHLSAIPDIKTKMDSVMRGLFRQVLWQVARQVEAHPMQVMIVPCILKCLSCV